MLISGSSYKTPSGRRGRFFIVLLSIFFAACLLAIHLLFTRLNVSLLELVLLSAFTISFLAILLLLYSRYRRLPGSQTSLQTQAPPSENGILLRSILDNAGSLIFIKDLDGKYILANRSFLELHGLEQDAVIGHTDYDFNTRTAADHYSSLDLAVIRDGQSIEVEELIHTPNGDRNLLLFKFPLLDADKRLFGIGGIATDITERTHYQQELIRARRDAEDTRQLQEQFLANMSHEIRTPMNGIQGMTNLLLDTPLNDQQKEFADIISRSMQNLLVIVGDILDFSKIKSGRLHLEKIDFTLHDVLDNIEGVMGQRIRKKGLEFRIDIDPAIPAVLKGDPYRLNQVLLNLIGNAIKFTEKGHIHVKAGIQAHHDKGTTLLFSVSDTGSGISEDHLPLIFDSFSQAGLDITRRYGGTGLGLAICSQLLKMQGGDITVRSQPGLGTRFEFQIPYEHGTDGATAAVTANPLNHRSALKDRHFLVAEDNEINQKLIEFVLKKAGGIVTIVSNGQEAVDALASTPQPPFDILIMDLQMPLMDGYQATRHIREEMKNSIPIIAMTATALKGEHLRCLETGMNDYMTKPFEFSDLYKTVADQLGKRNLQTGSPSSSGTQPTNTQPSDPSRLYDLSLLLEMEDNEYLLEMLDTLLSNTPGQLREMQRAGDLGDHETVYYISHKLKGSVSMFRALRFQEALAEIEALAKDKQPATRLIASAIQLYNDLEMQLVPVKEKLHYENSDSRR